MDNVTRTQLENVLYYMERLDPNGDYISFMEDLDAGKMELKEVVLILMRIMYQWKKDVNAPNSAVSKGLTKQQNILAAMI